MLVLSYFIQSEEASRMTVLSYSTKWMEYELEIRSEAAVVTLKLGASLLALRSQEHFSSLSKAETVLVSIADVWSAKVISLTPQVGCFCRQLINANSGLAAKSEHQKEPDGVLVGAPPPAALE